jgi:hypothetical protein
MEGGGPREIPTPGNIAEQPQSLEIHIFIISSEFLMETINYLPFP